MKSLQEAYTSIYSQDIQEDVVEQEVNIYEEAYQCLLEEGYEDNDAIEIVNYLYENNSLDDMLYEGKARLGKALLNIGRGLGILKPAATKTTTKAVQTTAAKATTQATGAGSKYAQVKAAIDAKEAQKAVARASRKPSGAAADVWNYPVKKRPPQQGLPKEGPSSRLPGRFLPPAKPIPTPKSTAGVGGPLGTRNVLDIKQVSRKYGMDAPAPVPAWGGKPSDPWSTSAGLVRAPRASKTASTETAKKIQAALPSAKELKALPPGKTGGGLATSGKGGPLARTSKGGMEWTGGPVQKVKVKVEPPAKLTGSGSQKALPTSNIVKYSGSTKTSLADRVKNALKNPNLKKLGATAVAGGFAAGLIADDERQRKGDTSAAKPSGSKPDGSGSDSPAAPSAPTAPAKPKPTAPAKPAPAEPAKPAPAAPAAPAKPAPAAPAKPSETGARKSAGTGTDKPAGTGEGKKSESKPAPTSSKKRMTKIDRDVEELMQMRARSMDRQGRSDDAAKLRAEIERKYSGYER